MALHTQAGLWPPQESCPLRGVQRLALSSSGESRLWSATSRSEGSAVHTQGGAYTRRSVATGGVLLFRGVVGSRPRHVN